jgi:ATP-dependent Clp endopeptidase proteolytic subunit ClpP
MNLKYRNQRNAEAAAKYWNKPLDRPDWYRIEASSSDDAAEVIIYDAIGWPFNDAGEFVRAVSAIDARQLIVRINSPGGDVFDAMAIYNALRSHKSRVITRIESLAASAASFVVLAGKEVQAYPNAMIMIHEPWVVAAGNQHDLRDIADVLEKINTNMVDVYAQNSNIGKREMRDLLRAETWFTASEAKERGFVDTILDGKGAKAEFDLSVFSRVPDGIHAERCGRELTKREIEQALRDAGATVRFARAVAAGCGGGGTSDGLRDADGLKEELKRILNILS